jgi:hypothetical protein
LDDLPGAVLVSGYSVLQAGAHQRPAGNLLQQADICAGWRTGGTIMAELVSTATVPVPTGPATSELTSADALAWHRLPALAPHDSRRRRLLDVTLGDPVPIFAFFQDSHMSGTGELTSVHEYEVRATLDPATGTLTTADARARALPWVECNTAVRSADGVQGWAIGTLRTRVRSELQGTRTCTHLNDTLRALDDATALLDLARGHFDPASAV